MELGQIGDYLLDAVRLRRVDSDNGRKRAAPLGGCLKLPMDWLKAIYDVVGAPYPVFSLCAAIALGGVIFGGGWYLIGREHQKDKANKPSVSSSTLTEDHAVSSTDRVAAPNSSTSPKKLNTAESREPIETPARAQSIAPPKKLSKTEAKRLRHDRALRDLDLKDEPH